MDLNEESSTPFLEDAGRENGEKTHLNQRPSSYRNKVHFKWLVFSFFIVVVTNTATFYLALQNRTHKLDQTCVLHTSQSWSPIFHDIDITYKSTRFNGSFFKETIYRQEPSPAVDAAWQALGTDYKPIVIPAEEVEKSGISPDRLKVGDKNGGPGYPAVVEALHQLHCLNLLRQSLFFNSDYYHKLGKGAFKNSEQTLKTHVGHCLDALRQTLMCNADIGLQPFLWVGEPPHPFPDFNREHKCRNFDDIRQVAEKKQGWLLEDMDVLPHNGALILNDFP